jgi:hypothetical protein
MLFAGSHKLCGSTSTDDGTRMSINVEMIGQTLMIQHYVAETATPYLCCMVSTSDAFTPNGRTRVQVIWTLSVKPVDDSHCEYTNSVIAHPTAAFMDFIAAHNISFEQAAAARQHDGGEHNRRETPLFAESIARRALARSSHSRKNFDPQSPITTPGRAAGAVGSLRTRIAHRGHAHE